MDSHQKIQELLKRIEELSLRQEYFSREIKALTAEIQSLQKNMNSFSSQDISPSETESVEPIASESARNSEPVVRVETPIQVLQQKIEKSQKKPSDFEKIIGESWINKAGIIILIIGVAIGTKYSIENNLIAPLTRIILGYISGISLLVTGIRLKAKFENYSAVLVSGAMAIFYFITFFAYASYLLISQGLAFMLMLFFTIFTVIAALNYNRSVIAHIGLVGAYAVPFLLSNNSGNIVVLLSYIAIVNSGILVVSIKKYWKSLYYVSMLLTWIIFIVWILDSFQFSTHKFLALGFSTFYFIMFYAVSAGHRILNNQKMNVGDMILLFINSFVYYGLGFYVMNQGVTASFLGIFTLCNALIHFMAAVLIKKRNLSDKTLQHIVVGLALTFAAIAIPVQLDGNWVTLIWLGMSVLLFWVGHTKKIQVYENLSKILLLMTFCSLWHDWEGYGNNARIPFLNILFFTSLIVATGGSYMLYLYKNKQVEKTQQADWNSLFWMIQPLILCFVLYITFYQELVLCFEIVRLNSEIKVKDAVGADFGYSIYNSTISDMKNVAVLAYNILFFYTLSFLNIKKIPSKTLAVLAMIALTVSLFLALTIGLFILGNIREDYINRESVDYYNISLKYVLVRYIYFAFTGLGVYAFYAYSGTEFLLKQRKRIYSLFLLLFNISLLTFLSNELITWLDIAGYQSVYKLGLSILWGVYSLGLIVLGIYYQKKNLRIGAMVLFSATLVKLFFYDIAHLNTLSKTIVFISLGTLLLIISFLYNKFKDKITEDEKMY